MAEPLFGEAPTGNQRYRNFCQRPGWLGVVEVGPEAEALVLGLPPEVPR
jgi:hypothetical protein